MAVPEPKPLVISEAEKKVGDKIIAKKPLTVAEAKTGEHIMKKIADSVQANFVFNTGSVPPFGYFHPEMEGRLKWLCCEDKEGNLVSLFHFEAETDVEKDAAFVTVEEAIHVRDELVKNGWLPLRAPTMTFTTAGEAATKQRKKRF